MRPGVVTVDRGTTVRKVANLMRGRSAGCVLVTSRSRIVGIITVSDLLDLIGRGADRPNPAERRGLHHRTPHRRKSSSFGVW
jgi:CBS domain-containing protein